MGGKRKNKIDVVSKIKSVEVFAKGAVIGNHWGGGRGFYPSAKLSADSMEKLMEEANRRLKDGSLDGGMGFKSLIGAILNIEEITTIILDEKEFKHFEYHTHLIGDLTCEEQDALLDVNFINY